MVGRNSQTRATRRTGSKRDESIRLDIFDNLFLSSLMLLRVSTVALRCYRLLKNAISPSIWTSDPQDAQREYRNFPPNFFTMSTDFVHFFFFVFSPSPLVFGIWEHEELLREGDSASWCRGLGSKPFTRLSAPLRHVHLPGKWNDSILLLLFFCFSSSLSLVSFWCRRWKKRSSSLRYSRSKHRLHKIKRRCTSSTVRFYSLRANTKLLWLSVSNVWRVSVRTSAQIRPKPKPVSEISERSNFGVFIEVLFFSFNNKVRRFKRFWTC